MVLGIPENARGIIIERHTADVTLFEFLYTLWARKIQAAVFRGQQA